MKPAVGAGSRDTRRHPRAAVPAILAHMRQLLGNRRSVLLQPYLPSVDQAGETALIYIDGRFSHAIRKGPLLPAGAAATAQLFAPEEIHPRRPGADELAVAEQVLAVLPFPRLLYARIDLIRGEGGEPRLLELELTEPSPRSLHHAAGSATQLAQVRLSAWSRH